jgi:sugar-specific transcriptional regulator TrmB
MNSFDLSQLNFSKNTSTIYLLLLESSNSLKAGDVIAKTRLQRSVVYYCLEDLLARKLILKKILHGVAVYSAQKPVALVDESERKLELTKKIAVQLEQFTSVKEKEVVIYEGDDIIRRISEKTLEQNPETVYFLGSSKTGIQKNLEQYWKSYHARRIQKGIECKILYDTSTNQSLVKARNNLQGCSAKYLPFGASIPMWFAISGDFLGILIPGDEPPTAFLIKSKTTADTMKKYFQFLWDLNLNDISQKN